MGSQAPSFFSISSTNNYFTDYIYDIDEYNGTTTNVRGQVKSGHWHCNSTSGDTIRTLTMMPSQIGKLFFPFF
jgi:hypothetical protein